MKTGVMTAEDVEAIRRLKESANAVMGPMIDVEKLDSMCHDTQQKSKFGISSRKRTSRVSPTNIGS